MTVTIEKFYIHSNGFGEIIDITSKIKNILTNIKSENSLLSLYTKSLDTSIIISPNNNDKINNLINYLKNFDLKTQNNTQEIDLDFESFIKANLLKQYISIPIINNNLTIDNFQSIILIDYTNKMSEIEIIASIID